ncbi:DUF4396 domain-containing protein [Noviherbaspirillum pedocola]|uniref:DUF4396 domain-containing protein n=1 Tax=Noviherbaspirillum pedocola TaxID=2801341 RepID=A0A934SQ20_9BURK|nr:DUF4396 domain-containing protein [Noviherbaspirillum pedocola]MBK4733011.1 DUF4396 domain-containing protein [Noviherbaspirillum pedocola]
MPHWLIILAWLSVIGGVMTALAIGVDVMAHPQMMKIMNLVWPITGLYFPMIGWWLYTGMGRPLAMDAPKSAASKPHWKSIFLSATHCGSGCVLGDLIGAPIVFVIGWQVLGERLYADYLMSFTLAYLFGIAFQYFPVRAMTKASPVEALKDAVKADTLSLIAFEVGMFAWMAVVYFMLMPSHRPEPTSMVFWFMMQVGMVLGFLTTYPANWLLVKWGVKSGM